MRFAHLADLHLGYRQYGLYERALDFNRAFTRATDTILESDISFVLLAGDLFHYRLPPAMGVRRAFQELQRLRDAGIPVVAIRGNHDASLAERGGSYLHLLSDRGLLTYLEGEDNCKDLNIDDERARIVGVGCYPEAQFKQEFERAKVRIDPTADYNILMLHQTLDKILVSDQSWPIYSAYFHDPVFRPVNYYAMGHIHTLNLKHSDLPAYYSGSLESWDLSDAETHTFDMRTKDHRVQKQKEKGFLIIDLSRNALEVKPIILPTRNITHLEFRYGEVDPKEANPEIARILPEFNQRDSIMTVSVEGYVKKGCRRSDLDSKQFRDLLDRTLKSRIVNDLRYPALLKSAKPTAQVTPEKALQTHFSSTMREEDQVTWYSNLTIRIFSHLVRDDVEAAKEEIENAS